MNKFLKQNWFKVGVLILVFVVIVVLKDKDLKINENITMDSSQETENLKFDIDLNKLDYPLPIFTKICIPSSKQYCQSDSNCSSMKPLVFLLIDEIQNKYYRCDNKPCVVFII